MILWMGRSSGSKRNSNCLPFFESGIKVQTASQTLRLPAEMGAFYSYGDSTGLTPGFPFNPDK
jgi:hypothetical protein